MRTRRLVLISSLLVAAGLLHGCNLLVGAEDIEPLDDGSVTDPDASVIDGPLGDGAAIADAAVIDARPSFDAPPVDAGPPDARPPDAAGPPDAPPLPPDATVLHTIGWPDEFSGQVDLPDGYVVGRKVHVSGNPTLFTFGVITKAGGPDLRMGLYTDSAGAPGTRVAASSVEAATAGVNEFPTSAALTTGDYWIMIAAAATVPLGLDSGINTDACVDTRTFANALPSGSFGPASCFQDDAINLYIVVAD